MRALTISELERLSGVPRGVVYFYIKRGLLPRAQKASATRAVYSEQHLELLGQIARLKAAGYSLADIEDRVAAQVKMAAETDIDLAASHVRQRRHAILQEAARQFAEKGFRGTRISDIVKALGIAPQQLYGFFPTKYHLFVACYNVYFRWTEAAIEPRAAEEPDLAAGIVWRMYANLAINALSPELQAFAQAESIHESGDLGDLVRGTFETLVGHAIADLRRVPRKGRSAGLLSDELVAYAMFGAFESILMRISWDKTFTTRDAMQNLLAIHLAIEAVYEGRADISERWAALEGLVDRLSRLPPLRPSPGSLASQTV